MSVQITPSSRVSDLINVLSDPVAYVSGVLSNFAFYGYDRDASTVRIGITGTGIFPNYKIEEPSVPGQFDMIAIPGRTFSGRNHRQMTELDDHERHDENWSTARMSFAELDALFSNLSQSKVRH